MTFTNTHMQYDISQQMCLYGRDEVITWYHSARKSYDFGITFRTHVMHNIVSIVKRIEVMACKLEREQVSLNAFLTFRSSMIFMRMYLQATNTQYLQGPNATPVFHSVTSLISSATNPLYMAKMNDPFMAWF